MLSDVAANSELNLLSGLLREGAAPRYWLPPYRGFFFLPLNGLIGPAQALLNKSLEPWLRNAPGLFLSRTC
jgi:hypothetical protein